MNIEFVWNTIGKALSESIDEAKRLRHTTRPRRTHNVLSIQLVDRQGKLVCRHEHTDRNWVKSIKKEMKRIGEGTIVTRRTLRPFRR